MSFDFKTYLFINKNLARFCPLVDCERRTGRNLNDFRLFFPDELVVAYI